MRDRKGFTLIELLIVVVIIGILAAIAIPKFSATRERAYFSAMKSDLRNLQSAQEMYYSGQGNYNYAAATTDLPDFAESQGVNVTMNDGGDGTGWAASATHEALDATTQLCAVYVGQSTSPDATAAGEAGIVGCKGES